MELKGPEPLKREHERLHEELRRAIDSGGAAGREARRVAEIMHPHFVREEEIAVPPLGLLPHLAEGKFSQEMASVFALTDALKEELPKMKGEHQAIVDTLGRLEQAAREEGKPEVAEFARRLVLHARTEEEVLYPAAILVGEYLKSKIGCGPIRAAFV